MVPISKKNFETAAGYRIGGADMSVHNGGSRVREKEGVQEEAACQADVEGRRRTNGRETVKAPKVR